MNKKFITGCFLSAMLSAVSGQLAAQTTAARPAADTTVKDNNGTPGRFFNTDKISNTSAVSTVTGETLYHTPAPNITNTLYGRLSGLTVTQGNGEPGNDNASLAVRGAGSYNTNSYGYGSYKIFVDGFEVNANYFSYMAPAEIESISVLKDAAALATFGMRGSNGVIWAVTKRGNPGKSTITFQTRTGFQQAEQINKPLNSFQYASLYNEAISNDNNDTWSPKYTASQLQAYQNGTGTNVDWYNKVLRSHSPYTDGDLIFNGGDSTARYNIVFDYANQQGLLNVNNTDATANESFTKYNLRTNLNFKMFNIFEARIDLGGRVEDRKQPNYINTNSFPYNTNQLFTDLATYPSNIYAPMVNGQYSGTALYPNNPYASINALGWDSQHSKIIQGNFGLREKLDFITKGLYLDEALSINSYSVSSYNKTATYARYFNGATTTTDKTTPIAASYINPITQEDWKQTAVTLGYDHSNNAGVFKSALGFQQSDYRGEGLFGYEYHYQNFNGRANYTYKNKYVGEVAFSYFGTDAFASSRQWGFYPAVSGAWIVSNESFLKNNKVIDFFKIRASVGRTGNADSYATNGTAFSSNGRYLYQQYYVNTGSFYTGNGTPSQATTLNPLYVANQDIHAEQSIKYNVGLDITLMRNLDVTADVFMDKRSDIITVDNTIPGDYGNVLTFRNLGRMTNKGVDANVSYHNNIGQVGYTLTGMLSYAKNTIDYMAEVPPAYPYNAQTGRPLGTPIGLVATGFYQLNDFNADGSLRSGIAAPAFGSVQPGDIRYKDLNGDGKIDQRDVTQIGNSPLPTMTYSFGAQVRYVGFDLSAFFQGSYGSSVDILYLNSNSTTYNPQTVAFVNNGNAYSNAQNAWAYYPDQGIDNRAGATYPRLTTTGNNNNYQPSTFWIKSGDYLRIRNAELGYSFASGIVSKLALSKLRVYVNAVNPVTWSSLLTNYHMDPETYSGYPALKSYNVGIVATF